MARENCPHCGADLRGQTMAVGVESVSCDVCGGEIPLDGSGG